MMTSKERNLFEAILEATRNGYLVWKELCAEYESRNVQLRRAHGSYVLEVDGGYGDDRIYLSNTDGGALLDSIREATPDAH